MTKKVLFVTEKWAGGHPNFGISNLQHNVFNTLKQSGFDVEYECVFMDEHVLKYRENLDSALVSKCYSDKPDLVVFSALMDTHTPHPYTVKPESFRDIVAFGVPVLNLWWDTSYENRMEVADEYTKHTTFSLILDRSDYKTAYPYKCLHIPCTHDEKIFCNPGRKRDIDVVFLGTIQGHSRRQSGIDAMKKAGIEVYHGGSQYWSRLDITQYAEIFQSAKIVVNFSWTYDQIPVVSPHQLKGRVFEGSLCGAMILESDNPYSKLWMEPDKDYVLYYSEKDLVEKAKFYLDDDKMRQTIAHQGCKKVEENYNPRRFWQTVFEKVGIDARRTGTGIPKVCL